MTNSKMTEIASKTLGDSTSYAVYTDKFDASLLNPMPRNIARDENSIVGDEFSGYDVWHCYEATFLTDNGHPISGILKIVYPSDTELMVESKSMKLFLNSFDMCKMGENVNSATFNYKTTVRDSIAKCLGDSRVDVGFFRSVDIFNDEIDVSDNNLTAYGEMFDILEHNENVNINNIYKDNNINHIHTKKFGSEAENIHVIFESLRSRCRHTKQKDTGTAIVYIQDSLIESQSLYLEVTSMRETNEFHEFCAERLFTKIQKTEENDNTIVALLYTRRGSLDINPIRYSKKLSQENYVEYVKNFVDANTLTTPTFIQ